MTTPSIHDVDHAMTIPGRKVAEIHSGVPTTDGAGVHLVRLLRGPLQRRLDPFLMLDYFGSDRPDEYLAGFPTHPHRGFETITYMIEGRMRHRDSAGHEGLLEAGGVQWMTAGRGVLHSEMPEQERGRMAGFQLWLNLPRAEKMTTPWYRDFGPQEIPHWRDSAGGVDVWVIAGKVGDVRGLVERPRTDPLVLDVHFPGTGGRIYLDVPDGHHAFLVPYVGMVRAGGGEVPAVTLAVLEDHASMPGVTLEASGEARALLVAGRPLGEPIVQYGPFVMNTQDEIVRTLEEYRSGRFARS